MRDGGHSIPEETIKRRYKRGILNFLTIYKNAVHNWLVFDNSFPSATPIAQSKAAGLTVFHADKWTKMANIATNDD